MFHSILNTCIILRLQFAGDFVLNPVIRCSKNILYSLYSHTDMNMFGDQFAKGSTLLDICNEFICVRLLSFLPLDDQNKRELS